MHSSNNYLCSWAFEETSTSIYSLGAHLHKAVFPMLAFRPIFLSTIISSKRRVFAEITLALNWKLIHRFGKEIRTKRPLPNNGWPLPSPLSSPSSECLSTRRPSRHSYPNEFLVFKLGATHPILGIYRLKQVKDSWSASVNAPEKWSAGVNH